MCFILWTNSRSHKCLSLHYLDQWAFSSFQRRWNSEENFHNSGSPDFGHATGKLCNAFLFEKTFDVESLQKVCLICNIYSLCAIATAVVWETLLWRIYFVDFSQRNPWHQKFWIYREGTWDYYYNSFLTSIHCALILQNNNI